MKSPVIPAFAMLALVAGASSAQQIVVCSDDWVLSDTAFTEAPDTETFVANLATYLCGGTGTLRAFTRNFGATGADLAAALDGAGFDYETGGEVPRDVADLTGICAVVISGAPTETLDDEQIAVLHEFVDQGGGLYVYGGTNFSSAVAEKVNRVINRYGVTMAGAIFIEAETLVDVSSATDPLFDGVSQLFFFDGHPLTGPASHLHVPCCGAGQARFAIIRDATPVEPRSWSSLKARFAG